MPWSRTRGCTAPTGRTPSSSSPTTTRVAPAAGLPGGRTAHRRRPRRGRVQRGRRSPRSASTGAGSRRSRSGGTGRSGRRSPRDGHRTERARSPSAARRWTVSASGSAIRSTLATPGFDGTAEVVGRAVLPGVGLYQASDKTALGEGVVVDSEAIGQSRRQHPHRVRDPARGRRRSAGACSARLSTTLAEWGGIYLQEVGRPADVQSLERIRRLPLVLCAVLAGLIAATVVHALSTAVRRRRRDLAVLEVLGASRRSLRSVGRVPGPHRRPSSPCSSACPLGVVVGRAAWSALADGVRNGRRTGRSRGRAGRRRCRRASRSPPCRGGCRLLAPSATVPPRSSERSDVMTTVMPEVKTSPTAVPAEPDRARAVPGLVGAVLGLAGGVLAVVGGSSIGTGDGVAGGARRRRVGRRCRPARRAPAGVAARQCRRSGRRCSPAPRSALTDQAADSARAGDGRAFALAATLAAVFHLAVGLPDGRLTRRRSALVVGGYLASVGAGVALAADAPAVPAAPLVVLGLVMAAVASVVIVRSCRRATATRPGSPPVGRLGSLGDRRCRAGGVGAVGAHRLARARPAGRRPHVGRPHPWRWWPRPSSGRWPLVGRVLVHTIVATGMLRPGHRRCTCSSSSGSAACPRATSGRCSRCRWSPRRSSGSSRSRSAAASRRSPTCASTASGRRPTRRCARSPTGCRAPCRWTSCCSSWPRRCARRWR